MRRICIVVLYLIFSLISNAQPVQDRGTTAVTVRDWRWMGGYNAFMPRYLDTTAANLQKGIDSSGALIYCYSTQTYWYRQNNPKKWVNLGNASNIGNTIYTGNGRLNSDRIVSGGNHQYAIYFDSTQMFLNLNAGYGFNINNNSLNAGVFYIGVDDGGYASMQFQNPFHPSTPNAVTFYSNNSDNYFQINPTTSGTNGAYYYGSLSYNRIDTFATRHYSRNYTDSVVNSNVPILTLQDVTDNGNTTTQDVTVNNISTKSVIVTGTNGNGHIHLRHQSSDATGTGQSTTLFANSNGYLKWKNDGNYYSTLSTPQTADRVYTFQNKSYTLADSTTLADSVAALRTSINSKGSGSVTSIATTSPILGGTITTTGTISADTGRGNNQLATGGDLSKIKDSLAAIIATKGSGTVTSISTTSGLGITSSVATSTTTPNISIAVDTGNSSILSRQRAATTYQVALNGTGLTYSTSGTISYKTQIDSGWKTWTEAITWTATTAPSGTSNNIYRWSQIGKLVHLEIRFHYATNGTSVSALKTNLPSEMPLPSVPTAWDVTSGSILYYAVRNVAQTTTGIGVNNFCSINYGGGVSSRTDKIQMNFGALGASKFIYAIDYYTD